MLEKTWIGVTRQRWKIYALFGLMALFMGWFVATLFYADEVSADLGALMIIMVMLLGLTFILWAFLSLHCPFCRSRVIWKVLRVLPHQESVYVAFFLLTNCPTCKRSFFETSSERSSP